MSAADLARALAALPVGLPLPDDDRARLAGAAALAAEVAAAEAGARAALARAIGAVVDGLLAGAVRFEGYPYLASAADALAAGAPDAALAAARFELESLLPPPGGPAPRPASPDVPLASVRRRGRRR